MVTNNFFSLINNQLDIATECAELSTFLKNPDEYLETTNRRIGFQNENSDILYTEVLKVDGCIYAEIIRVGKDLEKYNLYDEAISFYTKMIARLETFKKSLTKDDYDNVDWSIQELKETKLEAMKKKEFYESGKKSILAKYDHLFH